VHENVAGRLVLEGSVITVFMVQVPEDKDGDKNPPHCSHSNLYPSAHPVLRPPRLETLTTNL
jgi:hypothetical protein